MFTFIWSSFDLNLFEIKKNWKKIWRIRKWNNWYFKYWNDNLARWKFYKDKKSLLSSYWLKIEKKKKTRFWSNKSSFIQNNKFSFLKTFFWFSSLKVYKWKEKGSNFEYTRTWIYKTAYDWFWRFKQKFNTKKRKFWYKEYLN